jgi:hypothetical protein
MHARVETLLKIIQVAFPDAFPDAVAFLHQQTVACKPVREHPNLDAYDNFQAKRRSAAKCKTEGNNSDDDREEETSRKRRWMQRRVVEDEMDVDTDVPVHNQSGSRVLVPAVDFSDVGWPDAFQMGSSPLSKVEGVAGPPRLMTEDKEKTPGEMEIEDVASPSGDPAANAKPVEALVKMEEVPVDVNRVQYKVVEVLPKEPALPVIEGAPLKKDRSWWRPRRMVKRR